MANVALAPRVDGEIPHGNVEQQVAAPQLNRYVQLAPDASEYEWYRSAWNTAWWFVFIGYALLAVGGTVLVGITTPAYLPMAMLASTLGMYPAANFADECFKSAREYDQLAAHERGIAGEIDQLPEQGLIDLGEEQGRFHQDYRRLAGRYVYWRDHAQRLNQTVTQRAARVENESPDQLRHRRLSAFKLKEEMLVAKVCAAYFAQILHNPLEQRDLSDLVHFVRIPAEMRLVDSNLSLIFDAESDVQDPFLVRPDGEELLQFDLVDDVEQEDLRTLIFNYQAANRDAIQLP